MTKSPWFGLRRSAWGGPPVSFSTLAATIFTDKFTDALSAECALGFSAGTGAKHSQINSRIPSPEPRYSCSLTFAHYLQLAFVYGGKNDLMQQFTFLDNLFVLRLDSLEWQECKLLGMPK